MSDREPEDGSDRESVAAAASDGGAANRPPGGDVTTQMGRDHGSDAGPIARADAWMAALRDGRRRRRVALAVGILAGLAAAAVHWLGLVLGGVLVGLTRRRLVGAVVGGLSFGVLAVVLTVAVAPAVGPGEFAAFTPVNYLTVVLALVLPVCGALARYVL